MLAKPAHELQLSKKKKLKKKPKVQIFSYPWSSRTSRSNGRRSRNQRFLATATMNLAIGLARPSASRALADLMQRRKEPKFGPALEIPSPSDAAVVFPQRVVQFHAAPLARCKIGSAHKAQDAGFAALCWHNNHAVADCYIRMQRRVYQFK